MALRRRASRLRSRALGTLLQLENSTKILRGLVANDQISLEVGEEEIHTLLGENGAGEKTPAAAVGKPYLKQQEPGDHREAT